VQLARACLAWPDRKGPGGEGRVDAVGSLQGRCTCTLDWRDQCRCKCHRQRFEPIHQRIGQWSGIQRLPEKRNVSEGNAKKCNNNLLHLATSSEMSITRRCSCRGGLRAAPARPLAGTQTRTNDPDISRSHTKLHQPAHHGCVPSGAAAGRRTVSYLLWRGAEVLPRWSRAPGAACGLSSINSRRANVPPMARSRRVLPAGSC
jgi:hypothetical protein